MFQYTLDDNDINKIDDLVDEMETEQDTDNSKIMQDCVHEAFDQLKPATLLLDQTFVLPPPPTQRSVSWGEETSSALPSLPSHSTTAGTTDSTTNASSGLAMSSTTQVSDSPSTSDPVPTSPSSLANDTSQRTRPIPVTRKLCCHCTHCTFYDPSNPNQKVYQLSWQQHEQNQPFLIHLDTLHLHIYHQIVILTNCFQPFIASYLLTAISREKSPKSRNYEK